MSNRFSQFRRIAMALTIPGIIIAAYLTWTHFSNTGIYCVGGSGGCDIVQQSQYSAVAGIPVALLGLIGYLVILAVFILEETQGPLSENGPILAFAFTLTGFLYSAYLTYLELFVIFAICQYCVASASIMAIIFGISIYRLILRNSAE
jgi:uncharacterized membrane protein